MSELWYLYNIVMLSLNHQNLLNARSIILYENCHKTKYVRKQGLKKIYDLDNDAIHLLEIRAGHIFTPEIDTICLHHEQVYISK